MAEPSVRLIWSDPNNIEKGHKVYRNDTPMDIANMPSPIIELAKNTVEYEDFDVIEGNFYYYRVGAFIDGYEQFSEEVYVEANSSTVDIHDIFADGSAIATYQFNGNLDDLGGSHSGTWAVGQPSYDNGSIIFDGTNGIDLQLGSIFLESLSVWVKCEQGNTFGNNVNRNNFVIMTNGDGDQRNLFGLGELGSAWSGETFFIYPNSTPRYTSNTYLSTSEWIHIVVTWDNNIGNYRLFADNNEIALSGSSSKLPLGSVTHLGYRPYYDQFHQGQLNQMRLFNRTISISEINMLYQEGQVLLDV